MAIKKVKIYKPGERLTPKQQRWIDEYIKCDNLTEATINAGYTCKNPRAMGYQNSVKFKELVEQRRAELQKEINNDGIAELEDIFKFWTDVFNSDEYSIRDRIKASELLAKSKGAFVEKREVKVVETDWFIEE